MVTDLLERPLAPPTAADGVMLSFRRSHRVAWWMLAVALPAVAGPANVVPADWCRRLPRPDPAEWSCEVVDGGADQPVLRIEVRRPATPFYRHQLTWPLESA